ncbi:MAG: tRNA-binding protein [Candidatus Nanohaloarchaea archaeon]|jgi:tRNA-binding protein
MSSPFNADIHVGTVQNAETFEEAEKPGMIKLWISIQEEEFQSAAQLAFNHEPEELEGKQVLCVTSLDYVRIAGFKSEVLTLGVPGEDGNPVLVTPEDEIPEGGKLY